MDSTHPTPPKPEPQVTMPADLVRRLTAVARAWLALLSDDEQPMPDGAMRSAVELFVSQVERDIAIAEARLPPEAPR